LTALDRTLLQRCLNHDAGAWNDFVDRYLGLIYHVVHHTAHLRSVPLSPEDIEDVAAEVLLQLVSNNYAILRQFRGQSSLATYLTVIARRSCIHELVKRSGGADGHPRVATQRMANNYEDRPRAQVGLENLEEVQKLLKKLPAKERQVVRLFYFEGRNYEEISTALHVPVNSIGPILSRARQKLRREEKKPAPAPAPLRTEPPSRATQQPNPP
jgi:RNA polymerase sigma-70 factor (ECF subfamily)